MCEYEVVHLRPGGRMVVDGDHLRTDVLRRFRTDRLQCPQQGKRDFLLLQVDADRLADLVTGGVVEHVVPDLEGRSEPDGIGAQCFDEDRVRIHRHGGGNDGGLEERRRLAVDDPQVVAFVRVAAVGLLHLEHLPFRQVGEGLCENADHLAGHRPGREQVADGPHEPEVPDQDGRTATQQSHHRRRPPAPLALVNHVVMQEGRVVHQLRRRRYPDTVLIRRPGAGARRKQREHRAQLLPQAGKQAPVRGVQQRDVAPQRVTDQRLGPRPVFPEEQTYLIQQPHAHSDSIIERISSAEVAKRSRPRAWSSSIFSSERAATNPRSGA